MRKSGYYWVKLYNESVWLIAEYCDDSDDGGWFFPGDECVYTDSELFAIDETQILKP